MSVGIGILVACSVGVIVSFLLMRLNNEFLTKRIDELQNQLDAETKNLAAEFTRLLRTLDRHDDASGGFWRTAAGDVLRIRDMSDGHLKNCLKMPRVSRIAQVWMAHELARRAVDRECRSKDAARPCVGPWGSLI